MNYARDGANGRAAGESNARFVSLDVPSSRTTQRERPLDAKLDRALRIGIDAEALRKPLSGVGHYVWNLCKELEQVLPNARFYAYGRLGAESLALPSARWILRRERVASLRRVPSFAWLRTRGALLCMEDELDAFWAGRTLHANLPAPVRTICTVHDLNHLVVPGTMERATLFSHRLWFARDLARASCVLANSEGTAARLRERLGILAHGVIKPGLAQHFRAPSAQELTTATDFLRERGVHGRFFLSVATLEPRKNLESTLRAYLSLRAEGKLPQHALVLVGQPGWKRGRLERLLRSSRERGVVLAGYVSDALMPALYALADALVLPSLYEGFGMPALEARACGTRSVVSHVPELRESAGAAGICVAPTVQGVRKGLLEALQVPTDLSDTELVREEYSWRRGALQLARSFV
jgi:glycosyltransferase involved in cell wall biosynthesis